jgi:hypothetical protein
MAEKLVPGTFYGETVRTYQTAGFCFAESSYPANLAIPAHAHAERARLSRNSQFILDPQSGHHIQLGDPKLVITAIRRVVEAARNHTRLTAMSRAVGSAGCGSSARKSAGPHWEG